MAHFTKLTPKKKEKFLRTIAECADVSKAAKAIGVSRAACYQHRKKDSDFAKAWKEAKESALDGMEAECYRRVVIGVDKPITYQGKITATYKDYSDRLLMFYLKKHRPEYRDRARMHVSGRLGGPIECRDLSDTERASRITAILDIARARRDGQ